MEPPDSYLKQDGKQVSGRADRVMCFGGIAGIASGASLPKHQNSDEEQRCDSDDTDNNPHQSPARCIGSRPGRIRQMHLCLQKRLRSRSILLGDQDFNANGASDGVKIPDPAALFCMDARLFKQTDPGVGILLRWRICQVYLFHICFDLIHHCHDPVPLLNLPNVSDPALTDSNLLFRDHYT